MSDDRDGHETLFKGPADRRVGSVLAIATDARELARHCQGTLALLTARGVAVHVVVVVGHAPAGATALGHAPLTLPGEDELRSELVERIRAARPDAVLSPDPTPMLRQHPDRRRVARCALDAAWPYAGDAGPKEAWVFGGPAPDLFVDLPGGGEECFAQVDLRERS